MQLRHLLFAVLAASCATTKQPPVAAPHRGFPPSCVNRPALQLVKLATPATAAELAWARDFGAAYGLSISWDEPSALPPAVTTALGAQQVAEDLVAALDARKAKPPRTTIVVGLTDQDLFIRGKTDWRWAFGLYEQQTVVISTARMEPGDARFSGRLSKHLARVLGTIVCGLPRTGPPRSELRREVGGLDDLDEIEEFNWELEEKPQALDRDAVRAQLLQIDELIKSKQPKQAIAVAEEIIAQYEAAYPESGPLVFCAVNAPETLYYSMLTAQQGQQGVVLDSTWSVAWFFKGFALAELKRYPAAEVALERALKLSPQNSKFLSELGFVQEAQKRPLEAIKTFERALAAASFADEERQDKLRARARRGIGFNQIDLGDLDGAEKNFLEALKLEPDDQGAVRELKYIEQQRRGQKNRPN